MTKAASEPEDPAVRTDERGPVASVLLVDDHKANLLALRAVLEPLDVRLVEASSGFEALQQLLRDEFAAILLDVQMPGMDGFETAAFIRQREQTREVPILFVSAIHRDEGDFARGYAHGAVDYLTKPFNPTALRAKVSALVDLWRRGESLRRREARMAEREQERLKSEVHRREEQLRLIVDGVRDHAISMLDPEGRVQSLNAPAERIKGWRLDEVRGAHYRLFFTPEDRATGLPERELEIARTLGRYVGEGWRRRKDGSLFYASVSVSALRGQAGELVGFVKVTQDITEQQRLAEEQRRATRGLRFLAEASARLASSFDYRSTLADIARLAVPDVADWCEVDVLDEEQQVELLAVAHADPGKVETARELRRRYPVAVSDAKGLGRVMATGEPVLVRELSDEQVAAFATDPAQARALRELGLRSAILMPIAAHGRVLGAITLVSGESGRRFDENDLALAEDLAGRAAGAIENARLFALNQRERRRAEEANRAKDEFLSVASHELRTPLNAILGWSRMLRTGTLPEDKRVRAVESIERNAAVQAQLVEDILDVSRIITGKLRLSVSSVDLGPLVEAAIDVVRPAADAKGVRLQPVLDARVGLVQGDATRLQQIVWNLLSNAVKFTPRGGRVFVQMRRVDSRVEIEVSDTGSGIDPSFLPHVFESFRQADASVTRTHGGLGLGLAIVKHLVELHGGLITAHSEGLGKGASFLVRIPVAAVRQGSASPPEALPGAAAAATPGAARSPGLDGVRVLVVDDDADARELLRTTLEQCRASVRVASSVDEAFAALDAELPDVLVSDIGMPRASGYELVRRLRARPAERGGGLPAIALTAYADVRDRTRALGEGFTAHLAKPVDVEELALTIAALLGRAPRPEHDGQAGRA